MSSNLILVVLWTPFFFLYDIYETCPIWPLFHQKKKCIVCPKPSSWIQVVTTRTKWKVYRCQVSILGTFGYEPNEIPLLHNDDDWSINLLKFKDMYVVYIYEKLPTSREGGGERRGKARRGNLPIPPQNHEKKKTTEVWFEHTRPEAEGF